MLYIIGPLNKMAHQTNPIENISEEKECNQKLKAVMLIFLLQFPFFTSLLSRLEKVPTKKIETVLVTKENVLFYNPEFILQLTLQQLVFVFAHLVLHPALGFFFRSEGWDKKVANEANNHVINLLLDKNFKSDPAYWIENCEKNDAFSNKPLEEVYSILLKTNKNTQNKSPLGKDATCNEEIEKLLEAMGKKEKDPMRAQKALHENAKVWEAALTEAAANASQHAGTDPAFLDLILGNIPEPKINWEEQLVLKLNEAIGSRQVVDWNTPGRRYSSLDVFVPTEKWPGVDVAVYFDTSGSISKQQLQAGVGELLTLLKLSNGRLRVLEGDAKIHKDCVITEVPKSLKGGGGTSFVPLFDHLEENPANCVVVFTDTWGGMPKKHPTIPVIWAVYETALKDASVPFGEIIAIPENQ